MLPEVLEVQAVLEVLWRLRERVVPVVEVHPARAVPWVAQRECWGLGALGIHKVKGQSTKLKSLVALPDILFSLLKNPSDRGWLPWMNACKRPLWTPENRGWSLAGFTAQWPGFRCRHGSPGIGTSCVCGPRLSE